VREWKSLLKKDRTEWLLEASEPSLRYWTLKWLLDRDDADPELLEAQRALRASAPVQRLLADQRPEGYWGADPEAHAGTRAELHLLHWLGLDGGEPALKAAGYLAQGCLEVNGAYRYTMPGSGREILLPCHGAELARFMLRFGLARDLRLKKLVDWLLSLQKSSGAWPCPSRSAAPSCLFATALFLRLVEELRKDREVFEDDANRWALIRKASTAAADLFLTGGFARAAGNRPTQRWYSFGFPLQWDSDVLELLRLVAPHSSLDDPRIAEPLGLVMSKQRRDGTWASEKEPKGGKWMVRYVHLDPLGSSSKWVTLAAYRSLKALAH